MLLNPSSFFTLIKYRAAQNFAWLQSGWSGPTPSCSLFTSLCFPFFPERNLGCQGPYLLACTLPVPVKIRECLRGRFWLSQNPILSILKSTSHNYTMAKVPPKAKGPPQIGVIRLFFSVSFQSGHLEIQVLTSKNAGKTSFVMQEKFALVLKISLMPNLGSRFLRLILKEILNLGITKVTIL